MPRSNFSRRAGEYDSQAHLQADYASSLVEDSLLYVKKKIVKIADLGCGTGAVGRALRKKIPDCLIENYDISSEMLDYAKAKIGEDNCNYILGSVPVGSGYDLIISNFALQWFDSLSSVLNTCADKLGSEGILSIALPVDGSFDSLKKSFKEINAQEYFFNFPKAEEVKELFKDHEILKMELSEVDEEYDTTMLFLKNIHGIGANQSDLRLSPSKLRKLIAYHDELFADKIIVRYKILKMIIKRVPQ